MANKRQIKRRIVSAKNIAKITSAMEMVAASKMKRAQTQALEARPYARALYSSLQKLAQLTDATLHPLLAKHETGIPVLIVISTEKGLCGSLNTNLFKTALTWCREHKDGQLIAVGKKASRFFRFAGLPIMAQFTDLPEKVSLASILPITQLVQMKFLNQELRSVEILYTDFINTLVQQVSKKSLLPLQAEEVGETGEPNILSEYVFEPSPKVLLNQLLPYYVENSIYQMMLEARASEQSARMVAMKNASDNAADLTQELQLLFNKSRQASITNELLEITTATLTLKG